jgi:hypothetical protein
VCDWVAEKLDRETGGRGDKGKVEVEAEVEGDARQVDEETGRRGDKESEK